MRPAMRLIAVKEKPAERHARASVRYARASRVLARRFARSAFDGRQPHRPMPDASRRARLRANSGVTRIGSCLRLRMVGFLFARQALQAVKAQRTLEHQAQRTDGIDVG